MSKALRLLLLIEVVLCFGPAIIVLMNGIIILPFAITIIIEGGFLEGVVIIFSVISGMLGVFGMSCLVSKILDNTKDVLKPKYILMYAAMGFLSVGVFSWYVGINRMGFHPLVYILPLLASLHLLYIGRYYLFSSFLNKIGNSS